MTDIQLHHGNCLDVLPTLPDCSVDSIVTDPPYELGFMGKKWDNSGIAYNITLWAECLRVLKPGGHLLAFGGTRTYHRMAVAIEDAGFEIRDSLHWIYGSGFPKSLDVSKAIDKQDGAEREVVGPYVAPDGNTRNTNKPDAYYGKNAQRASGYRKGEGVYPSEIGEKTITAPATDAARQWSGWGTALKPAHEPIVVARKPLAGTVAGNVLEWGTGALNIDGTRVGTEERENYPAGSLGNGQTMGGGKAKQDLPSTVAAGRWPANIIFTHNHDCADICTEGCPVRELDGQSGISNAKQGRVAKRGGNGFGMFDDAKSANAEGVWPADHGGGASRFFTVTEWEAPFRYVAKPGKRERNAGLDALPTKHTGTYAQDEWSRQNMGNTPDAKREPVANHHPTVKPLALMRWLVRLVTPPNGTVLEPFAGSGTTLVACHLENFNAIGIEMTDEYLPIIEGRLEWARQQNQQQELT